MQFLGKRLCGQLIASASLTVTSRTRLLEATATSVLPRHCTFTQARIEAAIDFRSSFFALMEPLMSW